MKAFQCSLIIFYCDQSTRRSSLVCQRSSLHETRGQTRAHEFLSLDSDWATSEKSSSSLHDVFFSDVFLKIPFRVYSPNLSLIYLTTHPSYMKLNARLYFIKKNLHLLIFVLFSVSPSTLCSFWHKPTVMKQWHTKQQEEKLVSAVISRNVCWKVHIGYRFCEKGSHLI